MTLTRTCDQVGVDLLGGRQEFSAGVTFAGDQLHLDRSACFDLVGEMFEDPRDSLSSD
jgi:hypothetical protein